MTMFARTLAALSAATLVASLAALVPAHAGSFTSSASSAASDSVGSVSDSFRGSSNSSSNDRHAANGHYEIQQVLAVAGQPGRVQLALKSLDRDGETLTLELPQLTLARAQLGSGDVITATPRPYGTQFAVAASNEAFFLVVQDAWLNELPSRPVTL